MFSHSHACSTVLDTVETLAQGKMSFLFYFIFFLIVVVVLDRCFENEGGQSVQSVGDDGGHVGDSQWC